SVRLLGRTSELDALERGVRLALEGSFGLLMIAGEAGLGKTRLLDELATSLVDVRVGPAGCSELERHLRYVPLAAALRGALTRAELDAPRLPALRQIVPELTLGEPPQEFAEVDALEALVAVIAGHAPLVLLLDDLQSADSSTLAALGYLQRRCAGIPVALVSAVAPEQTSADHPVRRLQPDTLVRLEPLTAAELAPLGIPDLFESTGGNPRFVTEAIARGSQRELSATLAEALLAQCRAEGDELFEQLFEVSREPAYIVDPREDRILSANQAGCAMLGYTHEELLATPVSHIHPAELPQLSEFLDRVLRDGQGSTIKLTCRTKQGEFLPTEMSLHAFDSGDGVQILGLVQDRSEHRQRDPED